MSTELSSGEKEDKQVQMKFQGGSSDSVYGLGLIGAWVYYIGKATTPQEKVQGFFKAFVWPALLVHAMFKFFEKE